MHYILFSFSVDGFFDSQNDRCFCTKCLVGIGIYRKRGKPAKDYGLPVGWCRIGFRWVGVLCSKKWLNGWTLDKRLNLTRCKDRWVCYLAYENISTAAAYELAASRIGWQSRLRTERSEKISKSRARSRRTIFLPRSLIFFALYPTFYRLAELGINVKT